MKIAVVVSSLKLGGMERVAVNLCDAFYQAGHTTDLIYFKNRNNALTPRNKEISIHHFDLKKGVFNTGIGFVWFIVCKLLNIIFKKTFPLFFAYAQARVFAKKLKQLELESEPYDLVIFRGQGTFEHIWPIKDPRFVYVCENIQKKHMYRSLSKAIFSRLFANRNVACVSNGALDSFNDMVKTHHISPKQSLVVSNPNDFNKIRQDAVAMEQPLYPKPYILGLGRLVAQKNFTLLVEAFELAIKKYNIPHHLVIVGDGKDRKNIEAKVKQLNLTDKVHFSGATNAPFPWYHQADLFVLSSKFEGLGMVLLESLACGTKIVCTDSKGGVRQIMQGQLEPFLCKQTPDDLADAIIKGLEFEWDSKFDHFIDETLMQFDGQYIVKQYIENYVTE